MGDGPIQPIIPPVTINTMLNNNRLDIIDRLNFVTCEPTFTIQKSGRGTKKPEVYTAAFDGHLYLTYFAGQREGFLGPLDPLPRPFN